MVDVSWAEVVFWIAGGCLVFAYAGYSLSIVLIGLFVRRKLARADIEPSITFLITAYNEEKNLAAKLEGTLALDYPKDKLEIIVASDGSTDRTDDVARSFAHRGVRLVRVEGRVGKTETQNQAVRQATPEQLNKPLPRPIPNLAQTAGESVRILTLPVHPHGQRFQTSQNLVCFPNAQHAANQLHRADQRGRVHLIARNDHTAHRITMTAKILRRAVDHQVCAELQRLSQVRRESVVDDESRTILARDLNACFDVTNFQQRI